MICASWPGVHLRDQHLSEERSDVAGVRGSGLRWRRCARGDLLARGSRTRAAAPGSRRRSSPSRAPAARRRRRRRPRASAMSSAMPATFSARSSVIRAWFVGLVADVAGAVLLLQAADRGAAGPGVPGIAHGRASRVVARVGQELAVAVGLGGEVAGRSRAGRRRRGSATAPRSWPGRCRRAGSPACGSGPRSAPPRSPRRSTRPGVDGGDHRQRRLAVAAVDAPSAGRLLGLGRHPGRRPGALDVDDHHRQLERRPRARSSRPSGPSRGRSSR